MKQLERLDDVIGRYDVFFCDVWGVVHNGVTSFPEARAALRAYRERGGTVVLITNAPRTSHFIVEQLGVLGVEREAFDDIVTSGDVTRGLIAEGPRRIFHIGDERELSIFDGLDVELVEEFEADAVVCTGLFDDDTETPEDYAEQLVRLRARNLPFICANPDVVVERGEKIVWCAGALARDFARLGGRTLIAGKPHAPIYEAALKAAASVLGRDVARAEILCIGDGVMTDIKGASDNGFDALYISGGIHAREHGEPHEPDAALMAAFLGRHGYRPVATMPRLR